VAGGERIGEDASDAEYGGQEEAVGLSALTTCAPASSAHPAVRGSSYCSRSHSVRKPRRAYWQCGTSCAPLSPIWTALRCPSIVQPVVNEFDHLILKIN
jgi:hypothetical protein